MLTAVVHGCAQAGTYLMLLSYAHTNKHLFKCCVQCAAHIPAAVKLAECTAWMAKGVSIIDSSVAAHAEKCVCGNVQGPTLRFLTAAGLPAPAGGAGQETAAAA